MPEQIEIQGSFESTEEEYEKQFNDIKERLLLQAGKVFQSPHVADSYRDGPDIYVLIEASGVTDAAEVDNIASYIRRYIMDDLKESSGTLRADVVFSL